MRLFPRPFRVHHLLVLVLTLVVAIASGHEVESAFLPVSDPLTGDRSALPKDWLGTRPLNRQTPILLMAGHADSQNMPGAGTPGEAVALLGHAPMDPGMRDELYWNLATARAIARLGRQRGVDIRFYDPPERTIPDHTDPRTNWSMGRRHAATGGYALEIHYDAYGPDGVGSGLIPPLLQGPSRVDESLAEAFGSYPLTYRGGLGGPRRGIALLEIGKLEGGLEASLRDPATRSRALDTIAERVVSAIAKGLEPPRPLFSRQPGVLGSAPPERNPQASPGDR